MNDGQMNPRTYIRWVVSLLIFFAAVVFMVKAVIPAFIALVLFAMAIAGLSERRP